MFDVYAPKSARAKTPFVSPLGFELECHRCVQPKAALGCSYREHTTSFTAQRLRTCPRSNLPDGPIVITNRAITAAQLTLIRELNFVFVLSDHRSGQLNFMLAHHRAPRDCTKCSARGLIV